MKVNVLLTVFFLSIIIYANITTLNGIVGLTKLDGAGCECHDLEKNDSVFVWIEGPDTVHVNDTTDYVIKMIGGPAIKGGYNVAAYFGILNSADTSSHIIDFQLTHSFPKSFVNDTVIWDFKYTAPDSILTDTIYSVANSVNDDGNPIPGDKWNFGENFIVNVIDNPTNIINERNIPREFVLYQNYPNPFNPSTKITYTIPSVIASATNQSIFITLIVYDILGNEIATLVNEEKPAGEYEVEFNAAKLTSGVYFYQLKVRSSTGSERQILETKKMLLLK